MWKDILDSVLQQDHCCSSSKENFVLTNFSFNQTAQVMTKLVPSTMWLHGKEDMYVVEK